MSTLAEPNICALHLYTVTMHASVHGPNKKKMKLKFKTTKKINKNKLTLWKTQLSISPQ
jgi:hypothetical protein